MRYNIDTYAVTSPQLNPSAKVSDLEHQNASTCFILASGPNIYTSFSAMGRSCINLYLNPKCCHAPESLQSRSICVWYDETSTPLHDSRRAGGQSRLTALHLYSRLETESANAHCLLEKIKALFVWIQSGTKRDLCCNSLSGPMCMESLKGYQRGVEAKS